MTENQIAQLEAGPETDALVSELVFGNKLIKGKFSGTTYKRVIDMGEGNWLAPEPYSTSIEAAWPIFDLFNSVNSLEKRWGKNEAFLGWRCELGKGIESWLAYASTAPLAICRAALKSILAQQERREGVKDSRRTATECIEMLKDRRELELIELIEQEHTRKKRQALTAKILKRLIEVLKKYNEPKQN